MIPFLIAIFVLLILVGVFLVNETRKIRIVSYGVKNKTIMKGNINEKEKIRIVYFSDLHLGRFLQKKELKKKIQILKDLDADIYLFGGDLIGKHIKKYYSTIDIQHFFSPLQGKCLLSIYGNHEYKEDKSITFKEKQAYFEAMGFQILKNQEFIYKQNNQTLSIYGMDDSIFGKAILPNKEYDILLSHEGDIVESLTNKQFLLSGHTHGGQIRIPGIPLYYRPDKGKKYTHGLFSVALSKLLVSNGLGYGKMKLRLFAPCEIVQIDYVK